VKIISIKKNKNPNNKSQDWTRGSIEKEEEKGPIKTYPGLETYELLYSCLIVACKHVHCLLWDGEHVLF
jgi:hypothetical protein